MVTYSEEWRPVPGFETLYSVSNLGRVRQDVKTRNRPQGFILFPSDSGQGYKRVNLVKDGEAFLLTIHSLVADAFIGPRPIKQQVDHIDGNKANNALSNLEYVSAIENQRRARSRNGKLISGETNQMIIDLRGEGFTYAAIALITGVSYRYAWNIVNGKTPFWKRKGGVK